jgi:putative ABC transport system permease protein
VGYDFFRTFDVELLAGRVFDPDFADDVAVVGRPPAVWKPQNIVIDRALAEAFGFADPEAAVGHSFYPPNAPAEREFRVIGVVENRSLDIANRYGAQSSVFLFNPALRYHVVRLARDDVAGALDAVDALWERLAPNVGLQRRFADDYFNESYASFLRINQAFGWLASIALVIATIGLFAMATATAGRRIREIGVRKTLGATDGQVLRMLLASFTLPIVIANLVAWPLAYIAARAYLDVFIRPIELTWLPFAACFGATVLVALLAVGSQTLRAARTEPAQVLRHE